MYSEKTLVLLERNVDTFLRMRQKMKDLGLSGKKGLLFYGPPGTGKTHTVHYLASQLQGHTTLVERASRRNSATFLGQMSDAMPRCSS